MNTSLGTLIVQFFSKYLINEKNCSKNTIESYSYSIRLLLSFCSVKLHTPVEKLLITDITDNVVLDYLDYLENERDNSPQSRNQRLASIKSMFRYFARTEPQLLEACNRICSIRMKKTAHTVVQSLDKDQIKAIITRPDISTLSGMRDHALLLFMHNTGARVQEVCDLNIGDINQLKIPQVLVTGKGNKQRVIPLWKETLQAVRTYLSMRGDSDKNEPLFLNKYGERLTRFGIGYILKKHTSEAENVCPELEDINVTPHTLRHTTALTLIQAGVDIVVVKEWLGHANIQTTMVYLEINIKMKQQALDKCPPPTPALKVKNNWRQPEVLEFLKGLCKDKLC